jgi:hypothetical protein
MVALFPIATAGLWVFGTAAAASADERMVTTQRRS